MSIVQTIHREEALPADVRDFTRDTITLGWEERLKTRGRRRSTGGVEFGLALPRGTQLRAGDCLVIPQARLIVEVIERREAVFVVEPETPAEWGLFAYQIGNGHQPLMITERSLVCPDLPGVEALLRYHRMPYRRAEIAFTPTSAPGDHRHSVPVAR